MRSSFIMFRSSEAKWQQCFLEGARSDGAVTERPTVLIHLINHLLQLFRSGILAQHPHHLPQFFSADAAIFCILNEDVKRSLELCKRRRGCYSGLGLGLDRVRQGCPSLCLALTVETKGGENGEREEQQGCCFWHQTFFAPFIPTCTELEGILFIVSQS